MKISYGISSKTPLNNRLNCNHHTCACRCNNFIWVSKKIKLIYFETPKCGCTSIKFALGIGTTFSNLHFAMAYLINSQRYCSEENEMGGVLTGMDCGGSGTPMSLDEFNAACQLAAKKIASGDYLSDPIGELEFSHFFGSPEQAVELFPDYRKFIVVRSPYARLLSAWNMFYNSYDFMLLYRVIQCQKPFEEKKSFGFFLESMWQSPNHHLESLGRFVPLKTITTSKIEVVSLDSIGSFWASLRKTYHLPALKIINEAKSYPYVDTKESEFLNNEILQTYYSDDLELLRIVS